MNKKVPEVCHKCDTMFFTTYNNQEKHIGFKPICRECWEKKHPQKPEKSTLKNIWELMTLKEVIYGFLIQMVIIVFILLMFNS